MRMAWCLHTVMRVAVCGLGVLGSLILWGCGGDESPPIESSDGAQQDVQAAASASSAEALAMAQAPYYAELDAAYPDGMPGLTTVEERVNDEAYNAERATLRAQKTALQKTAEEARKVADHYKANQIEMLRTKLGAEPFPEVVEERLARDEYYKELVAKVTAAEAAVAAKQAELAAVIRARRYADITHYQELKAAADSAVQAAGLPVRTEAAPVAAAEELADAPKPAAGVVELEDLSRETGIPIAPSAP